MPSDPAMKCLTPSERKEARKMLDMLHGKGPAGKLNWAYADGYFANKIEDRFGMSLDDLKKEVGYAL